MRLDVQPEGYTSASEPLVGAQESLDYALSDLLSALAGTGAMAGKDSAGQSFASQYDSVAGRTAGAVSHLSAGCAALANLVKQAAHNHASADAKSSRRGGQAPVTPRMTPVEPRSPSVPSASGGTGDEPDWWHYVVDHIGGALWPDADTGALRNASRAWYELADALDSVRTQLDATVTMLEIQHSTEIPRAISADKKLQAAQAKLEQQCRALGRQCDDFAQRVDDTRSHTTHIMEACLAGLAVTAVVGIGLTLVTFGGSDAAAAAAADAEIIAAAAEVSTALEGLVTSVGELTAALDEASVAVGEVEAELAPFESAEPQLAELADVGEEAEGAGAEGAAESSGDTLADADRIEQHLERLDSSPANDAMLQRIREAAAEGRPLTEGEQNFMNHELTEAGLMDDGMSYEEAHEIAMQQHPRFANYDPEVIQQFPELFNSNWFKYWGLR